MYIRVYLSRALEGGFSFLAFLCLVEDDLLHHGNELGDRLTAQVEAYAMDVPARVQELQPGRRLSGAGAGRGGGLSIAGASSGGSGSRQPLGEEGLDILSGVPEEPVPCYFGAILVAGVTATVHIAVAVDAAAAFAAAVAVAAAAAAAAAAGATGVRARVRSRGRACGRIRTTTVAGLA